MKISIILTCYLQERFIEESILSVINQKNNNRELLIGDDSPDDSCRNIILKYVKRYPDKIFAWHNNPNKGIVNNMLFLTRQIDKKSEYIVFLEGDDCLFPEYLEKKLNIFNKYPNIKLVYNEITTVNEDSKIISERFLKKWNANFVEKGKISYKKLISELYYCSRSSLMIRNDMLYKYKINPTFLGDRTVISDIYFFNQIANKEDIFGIDEPLVYRRQHGNSTSKNIDGWLRMNFEMIEYFKYLLNYGNISKETFNKLANEKYLIVSTMALKRALSISIITTIKLLINQCFSAIKSRLKF